MDDVGLTGGPFLGLVLRLGEGPRGAYKRLVVAGTIGAQGIEHVLKTRLQVQRIVAGHRLVCRGELCGRIRLLGRWGEGSGRLVQRAVARRKHTRRRLRLDDRQGGLELET